VTSPFAAARGGHQALLPSLPVVALIAVKRHAAVGICFAVEILVRLQTRIVRIAELTRLFVGRRVSGVRPFAADRP
jgi:hypothetical protein